MSGKYEKYFNIARERLGEMTVFLPADEGIHIGLPNKFVAPSTGDGHFARDQFYWDSYFIILGLLALGSVELARGMVDNFAYLQKRFDFIPNRNRFFNLGISQPPFLSSMVIEIFYWSRDEEWLALMAPVIEKELRTYWCNDANMEKHLVYAGLSRYCDHYINHFTAEHESGLDMTSRFNDHCLDYLPVDLNSLLYKYEADLAEIYGTLGYSEKAKECFALAKKRKKTVTELMWNEKKGFFFDYNYNLKEQSGFYSLAGFYPLWAGLASEDQAQKAKKSLKKFEYEWGLASTQKTGLKKDFRQWDYPNGWANLQWIAIKGLLNYGNGKEARRLAEKWVRLNAKVFDKTGEFWEKYNVIAGDIGQIGRYPIQKGFGWTNAIFIKLIKEFGL